MVAGGGKPVRLSSSPVRAAFANVALAQERAEVENIIDGR
jgi:hypothetical protein